MAEAGFAPLPERAAWRHHTARDATEVVAFAAVPGGWSVAGVATGVEAGTPWSLAYDVAVDTDWVTREVRVRSLLAAAEVRLVHDASGRWEVEGAYRPELDGVLDVDLEASAVTNTLPLHRTGGLHVRTAGPAAYVRLDLGVERLDQWYGPATETGTGWAVPYEAPRFGADFTLHYDAAGLVVDYPGLATRVL